ncbi:MAG: YbaB/EbfC family nucleoid-associated protein [Microthrixaceae bacterium]
MNPTDNPDDDALPQPAEGDDPMAALLGGLDLGSLMETAQQMTQQLAAAQDELAATEVEGSAGGNAVRVTVTGDLHPVAVAIDPAVVDPDETELLEDLVLTAWRDAVAKADRLQSGGQAGQAAGMDLGALGLDASALGLGAPPAATGEGDG